MVNELAPAKPIQIRKETRETKCKTAKKLYEEANEAKRRAVMSRDPENYRQAQNKAAAKSFKDELKEVKANINNPELYPKYFNSL